ncbi:MAG: tRNA pseudouridine(38-40) synthase TruA, partial [Eubacterium sp.]|nr:tRNA pseudouridine(38-40) synthase TruA [Eubacterium sp.]
YNMVRIMVGTLLFIAQGKIKKGELTDIIKSKDRARAGKTAPPQGLYLNRVNY